MNTYIAIFIGGGLGSIARYLVGKSVMAWSGSVFPWGTLAANALSCVILGIVVALLARLERPDWMIPLLIIGFCGGFSTFSTFSFETLQLVQEGKWGFAILNIGLSFISCIFILFALSKLLK